MLALVNPFPPDVHRASQPSTRKSSSSATRSSSATLSSHHPPSLQRQPSAPNSQPAVHFQLPRVQQHYHPAPPPIQIPLPNPPTPLQPAPFDIHTYPSTDLLKLLASLLTQIAATNDHLSPHPSSPSSAHHSATSPIDFDHAPHPPIWYTLTTASRGAFTTPVSTLTFHARNVPTITLEAYLLRILKYCPTTNHVFLSLLVYFDRMSKLSQDATGRAFVIDSYNIHRLVIAGVTVASKFFSDVFYTNSRYAKVGGLPLPELNQLELQFLLLNDFRLVISSAEMQRYAEQLMVFSRSSDPALLLKHPAIQQPQPVASSSSASSSPHRQNKTSPLRVVSPKGMGAIDAYGGHVPSSESHAASMAKMQAGVPKLSYPIPRTPRSAGVNGHPPPPPSPDTPDDEDEVETETETETETDGGSTTDDEPTIRPGDGGSVCSSVRSRRNSLASSVWGDEDEDGEMEVVVDSEAREGGRGQEDGERTPDTFGNGGNGGGVNGHGHHGRDGDHAMGSP
ncbi:uncharacterized protein LACBIDRAFT_303755 [Laccaria bicolor S238N-H82]|uniref:Predicted protein n=1 Tax=Laccaria bicolor (strain S238N-H82 / ATCC MYA-4686) TaxID=486041 RepID=B0DK88_LACBS|nr:uncharacterized protein LACBIDRAFT_303755 [Laccaria bicolor S238N-H82]EDR04898.1 predicted protein [Laccaria bicolor S238N-H82]|eukprot:XP_001884288.1 predicted protein [Laccaria bicolor S238N-H82]